MRTFKDGSGADSTAKVRNYLANGGKLLMADLIQISTAVQGAPWSKQFRYIASGCSDAPVLWAPQGMFLPGRVSRSEITSEIGLTAQTPQINWLLDGNDIMLGAMTVLQSFRHGLWDNGIVSIWGLAMPTPGDGASFGACEIFTGRIADYSRTRTGVALNIHSPLELLDQDIPTNLIEASNPGAEYGIGQPPKGLSSVPTFSVQSGSTQAVVLGQCTGPTGGQLFAAETFDFGYIVGTSGNNQGIYRAVRRSAQAFGYNQFYLYQPFPFAPQPGDTFTAYVPYARSATQSVSETHTVPSSGPYSVTVNQASAFEANVSVSYAGGGAFTNVSSLTATGQYTYNAATGTYLFYSGDHGASVVINYTVRTSGYVGFKAVPSPETTL